jgi:Uma2 family endonuclease
MSTLPLPAPSGGVFYPESDGEPMADNTKQLRWIFVLYGNLAALFRDAPDVFVGSNQFWYPVEGEPEVRVAPDVYVVFGRPKGDRPSYKQWEEGGTPMTVVFEVLSPKNTVAEMVEKQAFYEEHGVEEYYVYDPDNNLLFVYLRQGELLRRQRQVAGFVSPRLGIRFEPPGPELVVYRPDGRRFLTFEELEAERERERQQRLAAEQQAEQARQQRLAAEQRAGEVAQQAEQASRRAAQVEQRLARITELSLKVLRQEATPEETAELERLLAAPPASAP